MMNDHDSRMTSQTIISNNNWIANEQHQNLQEERHLIVEKQELNKVSMLGLTPKKDGDQWCVLWGENLQEGVSGFGDTPYQAILDFNNNFMNESYKEETP